MAGFFSIFAKKKDRDEKSSRDHEGLTAESLSSPEKASENENLDPQTENHEPSRKDPLDLLAAEKQSLSDTSNTAARKEDQSQDPESTDGKSRKDEEALHRTGVADTEENSSSWQQDKVQEDKGSDDTNKTQAPVTSEKSEKMSFFEKLKKTRLNLSYGISALVKGRKIDEDLYEELETALLTADLGVETTAFVIEKLRSEAKLGELHDAALLKQRLKMILCELLKPCEQPLKTEAKGDLPFVILMVGVNGAGKTTTIGKLAQKYLDQGKKVMLAAGDTFRAAAVEQLKEWAERAKVAVVAQGTGADSASVLYDALNSAIARKADILICDTAGRLQNKDHLMNELKKIVRVMQKISPEVPHEVLLVLDAATGQNAVSQAKLFKEAVDVSGLCLTKLDGTAKGGVVFSIADKFKLPIRYVGIGEKAEDLREFKAEIFVDALIDE